VLDASQPMLDFAKRAAHKAGVAERIALKQGDAGQLSTLFPLSRARCAIFGKIPSSALRHQPCRGRHAEAPRQLRQQRGLSHQPHPDQELNVRGYDTIARVNFSHSIPRGLL